MVATSASPLLRAAAGGGALLFRQLFDAPTGTFTYLLADVPSGVGVLIDPVFEQHERDLSLIRELGIALVASIDTHAHADHVTGSWLMHEATGCVIALSAAARAENDTQPLQHGDRLSFGGRHLEVRSTPGHTDGCVRIVLDDQSMAFSGDALLVRGCGRCDFQQGNAHTLWRSITERDFAGHMENMKLPHPGRIAEALPGNLRSGKPRQEAAEEAWAPLSRSYAGLPELLPGWVAEHLGGLTILDVRSAEEFEGPDGRIAGSQWIPLPELEARRGEISTGKPAVVVCHSGSRSALATQQLLKAGRGQVANLRGGLSRWGDEGYPLESATAS